MKTTKSFIKQTKEEIEFSTLVLEEQIKVYTTKNDKEIVDIEKDLWENLAKVDEIKEEMDNFNQHLEDLN